MAKISRQPDATTFLGIECGGTRTVALLAAAGGRLLQRCEAGSANLRLLGDVELRRHFRAVAKSFPRPAALGIGMAGARTEGDRQRIRAAAAKVWPGVACVATSDLETALAAAPEMNPSPAAARVLVLSGTGSCCYGKSAAGKTAKVGGWGHLLGDGGSGYDIGLRALKFTLTQYDHTGELPPLGRRLLRALQLNEPDELIPWAQAAGKTDIAALAVEVFAAARNDQLAGHVLARAVAPLVADALACARRLARPDAPVEFILAGGNLLKQPQFAAAVTARLRAEWPRAVVLPLEREGAWGAVALAAAGRGWKVADGEWQTPSVPSSILHPPSSSSELPPTEQRNPRSMKLDQLSPAAAIRLMLSEDAKIPGALLAERGNIEKALRLITRSLRGGGKLFYVGAGTSGRLGVLDASECLPTFRTPPDLVQGIIAGGQRAIWAAVEGAEDDAAAGARAVTTRGVARGDVVVGIAASGRTPFVWGALDEARRRGAKTVLLCFNPGLKIARAQRPDVVIAPDTGPEILTGSTRLKAGTATKLVLNIFTTLAMVSLGKVRGNLMVDLNPSNVKLRARAVRIVCELTGVDAAAAQARLERCGWVVARAVGK